MRRVIPSRAALSVACGVDPRSTAPINPVPRSFAGAAARFSMLAGLALLAVPGTAAAYVNETIYVPMRDGTMLATDISRPSAGGRYPVVMYRTPYGSSTLDGEAASIICDQLKFVWVSQDTRGQGGSEGVDDVFLSDGWGEHQDGYDTVDWVIQQPWSDGKVGLFGQSAMGVCSYLAAGTFHPAIKTAHVGITPWNFYDFVYMGGPFREALVVDWVEGQGAGYMLDTYRAHPMYDELWAQLDMRTRASELTIPIFHWGGWHDVFTEGPVAAFQMLQAGGPTGQAGHQELLMGPWTHIDAGAFSTRQGELEYPADSVYPLVDKDPIAWYQTYLQGKRRPTTRQTNWPVRLYVMGDVDDASSPGNEWGEAQQWPVPADTRLLYLAEGGGLSWSAPLDLPEPASFVYDPADPSPTIGGRELTMPAGPRDQRPLESRGDVLVFQTAPLDKPVTVVGPVKAVLFASSDAPDTDLSVRLTDVYPDGRSMLVSDGILKARYRYGQDQVQWLEPDDVETFEVDLGPNAQVFNTGHRIRILVSSSNYRRFLPSKNTTDDIFADVPGQPALNRVFFDQVYASHLELPEPRRGAIRPVVSMSPPSVKAIARAKARAARGLRLTTAEQDALSYEGGRLLMKHVSEQVRGGVDR